MLITNIRVAFGSTVELSNMWNVEAFDELWPDLWAKTITENRSNSMTGV